MVLWWSRRRLRFRLLILPPTLLLLVLVILPNDSNIRLAIHYFSPSSPFANDRWFSQPPQHPVKWHDDVAIILKSGFGTQRRISAWLDSVGEVGDLLIAADFTTDLGKDFVHHGRQLLVHDVVGQMMKQGLFPDRLSHQRLERYRKLRNAIIDGDINLANDLSKAYGWELDAMKFISSLELAYKTMPDKDWYLLVDDDTYILQPSMEALLGHFDPSFPYYIGNGVGNYDGRFAHGGSSVVLSQAAMRRLFANPRLVIAAHHDSLTDPFGDHLLAATLMKLGIYLEEEHCRYFNGERPVATKIRADRFCAPIVSFHGLSSPTEMRNTGRTFRDAPYLIRWIDLWGIYDAPQLSAFAAEPIRRNWDHVGRLDEYTKTFPNTKAAKDCLKACHDWSNCLAWTWDVEKELCHVSPWMIVGEAAEDKVSGLDLPRVKRLARACRALT
ncbi:Isoflavone reductase family protein [Pleurostoma richardsiae]|uniref:N-acetylgalactosaminide beta-1,3-galactosyltransferase n=1 Tax=Pleurostoma richardsiae TaxID=41990 RepID=A0AA38R4M0_9PEZI|nr:Isoflavone reductase family protein [Pleurostoma richardsiae]